MDTGSDDLRPYEFGQFRVDPVTRTLTRDGARVELTATVFNALLLFLRHPGRVISKDELLESLWPGRIVGESNLTQTIFKLRRALGLEGMGSGEGMIVTVSGRGYRFTPAVTRGDPAPARGAAPAEPSRLVSRRLRLAALLGVAACIAVAMAVFHPWSQAPPARDTVFVVAADPQNLTGDPIFDRTLAKAIEIDLDQSPAITILPAKRVQETLGLMNRPKDEPLIPSVAEEVCARSDSRAVLESSVAAIDGRYRVSLVATTCAGDHVLTTLKRDVDRREQVVGAVDGLLVKLRRKLGESGRSVKAFDVPLMREKTFSLDALKAYTDGAYLFNHGNRVEALTLFRRAVEIDPTFAAAWSGLGVVYANLRQVDQSRQSLTRAYALRDTVGERQKFHITGLYETVVLRDFDASIRNNLDWARLYPHDSTPVSDLADLLNQLGRYPEAIAAGDRALAINPGPETSYVVLARALLHGGRVGEAAAVCARAVSAGLAGDDTHGLLQEIAFARGDDAAAQRELLWSVGKPAEIRLLSQAARFAYRQGKVIDGEAKFARVADLARALGLTDYSLAVHARDLNDVGYPRKAREVLRRVPLDYDSPDTLFDNSFFGDENRATIMLAKDLAAAPHGTLLSAVYAPAVHAAEALRRGDPRAAVAALIPAAPFDSRVYDIPFLRGGAYLALREGAHAAVEYRKILDSPGEETASPLYPLAHLGFARALGLQGDLAGARREYTAALTTWKGADADFPPAKAARAERAAIERTLGKQI